MTLYYILCTNGSTVIVKGIALTDKVLKICYVIIKFSRCGYRSGLVLKGLVSYTIDEIIEEPDAVIPHVWICMGARLRQLAVLL
jgi:hypothetical protein